MLIKLSVPFPALATAKFCGSFGSIAREGIESAISLITEADIEPVWKDQFERFNTSPLDLIDAHTAELIDLELINYFVYQLFPWSGRLAVLETNRRGEYFATIEIDDNNANDLYTAENLDGHIDELFSYGEAWSDSTVLDAVSDILARCEYVEK